MIMNEYGMQNTFVALFVFSLVPCKALQAQYKMNNKQNYIQLKMSWYVGKYVNKHFALS